MNWQSITCAVLLAVAVATRADAHEPVSDGCGAASRDVAHELAMMRSAAIPMTADPSATTRPRLALDKHYALNLIPHDQMHFAAKPGRAARAKSPRGGAFQFVVPVAGRYRVSITSRHWIDIVDGEAVIGSADHFGPGCDVLHKIVEFDLPSGRALTLQISGQDDAIIGLAITASPRAPKQDPS